MDKTILKGYIGDNINFVFLHKKYYYLLSYNVYC